MFTKQPLVRVILIAALIALAGRLLPARADDEKALHIYDLARQLDGEDADNGNFTSWVNGDMGKDQQGRPGKLKVGDPIPDFQFKNFDKDGVVLRKSLKAPYILNFWASWCPPCRDEFPLLAENIDNGSFDLPVYFVNVYDTKANAQRFLSNIQSKVTLFTDDPNASFALKVKMEAIPQTILVDADGNIQAIHSGGMTDNSIEFFSEIASNPGIGGFDAGDPDQPPENMATEAGKSAMARSQ